MANTGLTVAVTGPTGDLGLGIVDALERSRSVKRIVGMARRPFDPAERGWRKTEYRRGDVTDKESVHGLVKDAHVVVHLAFAILEASDRTQELNVDGLATGVRGVGQGRGGADLLRVERRGLRLPRRQPRLAHRGHPGARLGRAPLLGPEGGGRARSAATLLHRRRTHAYVFRPCIVAGPEARTMIEEIPYFRLGEAMPDFVVRLLGSLPALKPVIPDPGAASSWCTPRTWRARSWRGCAASASRARTTWPPAGR